MTLTKSSLRRIPRLILPTTIATFIIWILTQLGAFQVAKHTGAGWTSYTSPRRFDTIGKNLYWLMKQNIRTWVSMQNDYDPNQWTLLPLLKGAMIIYVFIVATCTMKTRYRMMSAVLMWFYYYVSNDCMAPPIVIFSNMCALLLIPYFIAAFGMQFFYGVFLAELQNLPAANEFLTSRPILSRVISTFCMISGFCIASLPEHNVEWAAWSNNMRLLFDFILPKGADYPRFSTAFGLHLISMGLHCSPLLRDLLSNRWFLWLGKQSFAVYLLHGTLLRTVLCWMVYGFTVLPDHKDDEGKIVPTHFERPSGLRVLVCLPFWLPLNYAAAVVWTTYVDPWCARVTEKMVNFVKDDKEILGSERLLDPTKEGRT